MSCGEAGKNHSVYTGNQVGWLNYVGDFNFVAGGPPGSGLAAGATILEFIPSGDNRRVWLRQDAEFNDKLLDAAYPTIGLKWLADIEYADGTVFRVSDQAFYVQDEEGYNHFYDARAERAPSITTTVGEWLTPNFEVGDVAIMLNNRDGLYNDYLPMGDKYRQWTGVKVTIKVGFGEKIANYFTLFEGQVTSKQGLTATRDTITIKAYDKFDLDEIPLPPRLFNTDTFPDIDENYKSKSVPLVYGDWSEEVPEYGSVNAICVNANEVDPTTYLFKISDVALGSLDSVWLHRGERVAGKPQGPIRVADNLMSVDLDGGEFTINAAGVILDEPYYIANKVQAGPGSTLQTITSDNNFNFIEQGVKVGDQVLNGAPTQAFVTIENLTFKPTAVGAAGNGLGIEYYLLPTTFVDVDGNSPNKCYASYSAPNIRVGITQYTDAHSVVQIGKSTANAIKAAIYANPTTAALVRIVVGGTVPFGYPVGTKPGAVNQTVPQGPTLTTGGQDALISANVLTVSNFQITVDGAYVFAPGTEYSISTVQYKFFKSDKITVVCTGKPLNQVSRTRILDAVPLALNPTGVAVGFDATYWIADEDTQKIYNISFDNEVLQEIDYADIGPGVTSISGLHLHSDNKLWAASPLDSKVYRIDTETGDTGYTLDPAFTTGLMTALGNMTGVSVQPDGKVWLVDQADSNFYLIDAFSAVNPFLVRTVSGLEASPFATDIQDIAYDSQEDELIFPDRNTNFLYRVDPVTGVLVRSLDLTEVSDDVAFVTGATVAQDGTLMLLDRGVQVLFNYNDMEDASNNPAIVARDLLQKFGNHTYEEFDLTWMQTARQLSVYRTRIVFDSKTEMVTAINKLLAQYNCVMHFRFNKYALFYIHFDNFVTSGKAILEKDIIKDTFNPGKEMNQYFNSANGTYKYDAFTQKTESTDTYISPAGITFAGKEFQKTLDLKYQYRREDIDRIIPLHVRLSAPEPEFIEVTFGFRPLRLQLQDFVLLTFDESQERPVDGHIQKSGRRYTGVPAMVRKITYNLDQMTMGVKLWSLGNTAFDGYVPPGVTVGGEHDTIVLSSVGRIGRISPTGTIIASGASTVALQDVGGQDAETRDNGDGVLAWVPGYLVSVVDGATQAVLQTLTIDSVSGGIITFTEPLAVAASNTIKNGAGFVIGGTYLKYAPYDSQTAVMKAIYASFGPPNDNYPTSKTQELEDQRSGAHDFADAGLPYVLYPSAYSEDL